MGLSYADTQWTLPANATPEEKAWADKGLSWQTRLWIDDMFMITILQAQAYHTTGKREYMDRAVKEMVVYLENYSVPTDCSIMLLMFRISGQEGMGGWL